MESRRKSARTAQKEAVREAEKRKAPETPKAEERPKKIKKIYAKRKPTEVSANLKREHIGTPRTADSSSAQASPAPFAKLSKDSPLPTAPAEARLDGSNLQSVAKSGVLAASMARSRAQWLNGGIFERYWTKPRKSRGQNIEPPGNPPRESMTIPLGRLRVTIEPHTMDAQIYGIKDISPPSNLASAAVKGPNPVGRPPAVTPRLPFSLGQPQQLQVSSPAGQQSINATAPPTYPLSTTSTSSISMSPYPAPARPQYNSPLSSTQTLESSSSTNQASRQPTSNAPSTQAATVQPYNRPANSPPQLSQVTQTAQSQQPIQQTQQSPTQQTQQTSITHSQPQPQSQSQPQQSQQQPQQPKQQATNQDPVIQALARRAQENPSLKALMKIVAAGQANKEQLAEFQKHIDELTTMIRQQQMTQGLGMATAGQTKTPVTPQQPTNLSQYPQATANQAPRPVQPPPRTPLNGTSNFPYQQPVSRTAQTPKPPEKYKNLAIEFLNPTAACNSTPNDRLLFPKHAVLEFSPDRQKLMVSFLAVKSVSEKKYNIPVTMRLEPLERRDVLGIIERNCESLDAVKKHMDELVRSTERASDVNLILRTPVSASDEKRANLLSATTGAKAEVVLPEVGKRGRKKDEDFSRLCQYCYGEVAKDAERDEEGNLTCKACAALKLKAQVGKKIVVRGEKREVRAAAALMW